MCWDHTHYTALSSSSSFQTCSGLLERRRHNSFKENILFVLFSPCCHVTSHNSKQLSKIFICFLAPICVKTQTYRHEGVWKPPQIQPLGRRKQKWVGWLDQSQVQRLPFCIRSYYPSSSPPNCLPVCPCPCFSYWTDWWKLTFASIPQAVSAESDLGPRSCFLTSRLCLPLFTYRLNPSAQLIFYTVSTHYHTNYPFGFKLVNKHNQ